MATNPTMVVTIQVEEATTSKTVKDVAEELAKIYVNQISSVDNFKRVVEEKINRIVEIEVEKQVRLYL